MFKRGKSTRVLGSFHASDIPEFYGSNILGFGDNKDPDFIGTDALGMFFRSLYVLHDLPRRYYYPVNFANTGNPTIPHNPNSLLSTVDWKPWSSSADHPMLTFLDPAPDVSITSDNIRVTEINLLINISLHFTSGSLDNTGSMNEAETANSDDKADTEYILRSDEEL